MHHFLPENTKTDFQLAKIDGKLNIVDGQNFKYSNQLLDFNLEKYTRLTC